MRWMRKKMSEKRIRTASEEKASIFMGKSIGSSTLRLQELTRIFSSASSTGNIHCHLPPKQAKPPQVESRKRSKPQAKRQPVEKKKAASATMDGSRAGGTQPDGIGGTKLSHVVSDCVRRWFSDTLKEAKAGDTAMQVLVGQMYNSGYGVTKDPQKGRAWINKASKNRSSVWKVGEKQPGYNASDSDSDAKGGTN